MLCWTQLPPSGGQTHLPGHPPEPASSMEQQQGEAASCSSLHSPGLLSCHGTCSTHTRRVCSRASAPYLLFIHFYPFETLLFKGISCFSVFCKRKKKTPPKRQCPKRVNTAGSSHMRNSSMQSWAGSGSAPALGEHTSLDRHFQFLSLQLFSVHLFGERQVHVSKFGCIYNFSAWNRHSLS